VQAVRGLVHDPKNRVIIEKFREKLKQKLTVQHKIQYCLAFKGVPYYMEVVDCSGNFTKGIQGNPGCFWCPRLVVFIVAAIIGI
jgi:hypothetical protein